MGDVSYLDYSRNKTGPIVYGWELFFVCYTWNGDAGKQFGWFSFPELAAVGGFWRRALHLTGGGDQPAGEAWQPAGDALQFIWQYSITLVVLKHKKQ